MTEREAYIALNMISGIGPVKVRALVEKLGSAAAILTAQPKELLRADGIGKTLAMSMVEQRESIDPFREEARTARLGGRLVTFFDDDYPQALKAIHDPPLALYILGALEDADAQAMAMVGTRRASHYALKTADRLAYQLAKTGFTVVSGLARGIDAAAHGGALKAKGRTLAVLGSGLDKLYPEEHEELAHSIAKQGAVITEFPLGVSPSRSTFPKRNRIVSGLSMGVVVVEAALNSGSLITASQAAEQGRSVFAVPGPIDSPGSRGSHRLIKEGATLVEDVSDIVSDFEFLTSSDQKVKNAARVPAWKISFSAQEEAIVRVLERGVIDVDTLARQADIRISAVSSHLIGLEMKRVIRMLPGRRVELAAGVEVE